MNTSLRILCAGLMLLASVAYAEPNISSYQLINKERLSVTDYRYTYQAQITNDSAAPIDNLAYALSSYPDNVKVIDGELFFSFYTGRGNSKQYRHLYDCRHP